MDILQVYMKKNINMDLFWRSICMIHCTIYPTQLYYIGLNGITIQKLFMPFSQSLEYK